MPYSSVALCRVPEPHAGRVERGTGLVGSWRQSSRDKADTQPSPEHGRKPITPPARGLGCPPWVGALISRGEEGAGHAEEAALAVSAAASNSTADMGHWLERHKEQSCPIAAISCTRIKPVPFPAGIHLYTWWHQLFQMFPNAVNDTLDGLCQRALGHLPCPMEALGDV